MKHTHPELKRLDDVLDEELAEVLSSDTGGAAGESGYEGEVLSRRLIFENCATTDACFAPRRMAERSQTSKTASCEMQEEESVKQTEVDDVKVDVQGARRMFEGQSVSTLRQSAEKLQTEVSFQKSKQEHKTETLQNRNTALDVTGALHPHSPEHEFPGTDGSPFKDELSLDLEVEDKIKTCAALLKNNPFITANIEKEPKSHNATGNSREHQEVLMDNVKKRAHLFESLPFDKIRHQNEDEVEAMVENIRGTLDCLHRAGVIHSDGSIVEVGETMIAKKAKFSLSDLGPMINYDEVAEGGAQNFILQLVPRAHLKPGITYLKENKQGNIEATTVKVGFDQETECKTAQLVQVVEDILHQDNSLRKGVIIQQEVEAWAEVIVYSLYKYFNEEDVKSYHAPQIREHEGLQPDSGARELRNGEAGSQTSSSKNTPKDQNLSCSIRPEITAMGNVKLFKTCIEKGDLESLKAFHADSTVEEFPSTHNVATQGSELPLQQMHNQAEMSTWAPVDVEKLKKRFSGDPSPSQATAGISAGQKVNLPSTGSNSGMLPQHKLKENPTVTSTQPGTHLQSQDDHVIHKAELAEVVADCDEISDLQLAINALQQATIEAKSLHEKQKSPVQEVTGQKSDVKQLKLDLLHKNTEENPKVTNTEAHIEACRRMDQECSSGCVSSSETAEQEGEEALQGKLHAALESLERSNMNITRGDFKAAMIYRNSSHNHKKGLDSSTQAPTEKEDCPFYESKSDQVELKQENADTSGQRSAEKCRFTGPKPAIPPKPERLKAKRDVQPTNKSLKEETNEEKLSSIGNLKNGSAILQTNQLKDKERHQVKGSIGSMETAPMVAEKQLTDSTAEDSMTEANTLAVHFNAECQRMEKKPIKNAPVKPKRAKVALSVTQSDYKTLKQNLGGTESQITGILVNNQSIATDPERKDTNMKSVKQGSKVELREKKGRSETEAERLQRLSVHMDEIVKGNITAAMEIFDNLRKQGELQSILSRVEEIEKETSGVDVQSLRGIFENVPDWVVSSNRNKSNKVKEEKQVETMSFSPESEENKASMAHVFGNLERASEEILNLKEQTLARLMDIEEAIKKALYSVSTLKSESDIVGLSSLFRESFNTVQSSPSSANTSTISIGSCRAKPVLNRENTKPQGIQAATTGGPDQASPSSSPTFISIQSATKHVDKAEVLPPESTFCPTSQHSPMTADKFLTTATLTCNGERRGGQEELCHNPKRELSVLEVQTDREGNTTTVTERTDTFGNRIYSSRASTIVTAPPQAPTG